MDTLESIQHVLTIEGDKFIGKVKDAATDVLADGLDALLSSTIEAHSSEKTVIEKVAVDVGQHLDATLQAGIDEFATVLKYKAFTIPPELTAFTAVSALENSSVDENELQRLEMELSQLDEAFITLRVLQLSQENAQMAADVQHLQTAQDGLGLPDSMKQLAQDIQARHEGSTTTLQETAAAKKELDEFRNRAGDLLFTAGVAHPK